MVVVFMASQQNYDIMQVGNTVVVTFCVDTFDASITKQFRQDVHTLYEKGQRHFVFNFMKVNFIDSSGIGGLIYTLKAVGNEGTVSLCNVNANILAIFEIVNLNKLIPIFGTLEVALRQAQPSSA